MGNYIPETSKYANIEMTMVAKMKLIYPPTHYQKYGAKNHVYIISHYQMGITIKEERDESNLGGRQMDNTNRKCIFWNGLLQGTQSNVVFPAAAVAVGFFGHK